MNIANDIIVLNTLGDANSDLLYSENITIIAIATTGPARKAYDCHDDTNVNDVIENHIAIGNPIMVAIDSDND